MCLHCWLCNTQISSFRWLACPASGSTWLRLYSGLRWRKHVSLKRKHVLRHQESKILGRAANSAEVVLLSNSPIHFNTSSTSTEDKAHLGFLLQQFSYLLLLLLDISQPFFVNALCPISAQYWVWHVQDCRDLGRFNHHSAPWYIHIFPVLDWDPKQWLIVLTHHPSIHHPLHHNLMSIGGILTLSCEVCYFPCSQTNVGIIVCQRCSISYKRQISMFLTQNLTVQMTVIGIKETYCVLAWEPKGNESVAKRMFNESRWEGNVIHSGRWKLGNEFASSCIPDSDVGVRRGPTCGDVPVGWVRKWPINMQLIVKVDRIKLGRVVIPWVAHGGRWRHDDDGQAIGCQVWKWTSVHIEV